MSVFFYCLLFSFTALLILPPQLPKQPILKHLDVKFRKNLLRSRKTTRAALAQKTKKA